MTMLTVNINGRAYSRREAARCGAFAARHMSAYGTPQADIGT
ncbi:MAG TPA: hypothetical protein VFQ33_12645 [Xanthobacteraceae bacterium]|nr:hypothetical protein [Xanthobacteraceae bacterium]